MITLDNVLDFPVDEAVGVITDFIREKVKEANASGVVLGLSGGIDSSTAFILAIKALGDKNVTALIMPDTRVTPRRDVEDALWLVREYGVEYYLVEINSILDSYSIAPFYNPGLNIPTGNLRARIRMNLLYYYANLKNYLVMGTGDRSELLIGYFTKYGDGGVDILPIGSLFKTQVRKLGKYLGLPDRIVYKPSSPALWPGHKAEEELGLKYEVIDVVLYALLDKGIPPEKIPEETGISINVVNKILDMHRKTRHKRSPPPVPKMPWIREAIKEI